MQLITGGNPKVHGVNPGVMRIALSLLVLGCYVGGSAAMADTGATESVLLTKHANKAADYYERGDFALAKDEYRAVIGFAPDSVEPYEGLLSCAEKTRDWSGVAFAAEKIAALSPERKQMYEFDYGTALFNLNRYDEALPHLKQALATADIPIPSYKPVKIGLPTGTPAKALIAPSIQSENGAPQLNKNSLEGTAADARRRALEIAAEKNKVTPEGPLDLSKLENFENAIHSEFIGIAEYQGYDKSDDIRFNSPVASHWHIVKILKGPPLNHSLPLRYDFHTLNEKDAPAGWHFDASKMPAKGSKWIIFIEFAVPEGTRKLFTTYDGSFGRQEANDKNLNEIDYLLEQHNMKIQGL